jgi:uncharacterized protein YhhL (DUF1145 family)
MSRYVSNWVWIVLLQLGLLYIGTVKRHMAACDRAAALVFMVMLVGAQIGIFDAYQAKNLDTNEAVQIVVFGVPCLVVFVLGVKFFCGR